MTALANYQSPASAFPDGVPYPKEYSGNFPWARGPLALTLAVDYHQGLRPNTAVGGEVNPKDSAVQAGIKWSFGIAEIGAGLEQLKYANNAAASAVNNKMDMKTAVVNGRVNAGPGRVGAG